MHPSADPSLLQALLAHLDVVAAWPSELIAPSAARCEASRHRTLAHLRACQEQWLEAIEALLTKPQGSVTVLHPWRVFEAKHYVDQAWEDHLQAFTRDRHRLVERLESCDWDTQGKVNRQPTSIRQLVQGRLVAHEQHHLGLF